MGKQFEIMHMLVMLDLAHGLLIIGVVLCR